MVHETRSGTLDPDMPKHTRMAMSYFLTWAVCSLCVTHLALCKSFSICNYKNHSAMQMVRFLLAALYGHNRAMKTVSFLQFSRLAIINHKPIIAIDSTKSCGRRCNTDALRDKIGSHSPLAIFQLFEVFFPFTIILDERDVLFQTQHGICNILRGVTYLYLIKTN